MKIITNIAVTLSALTLFSSQVVAQTAPMSAKPITINAKAGNEDLGTDTIINFIWLIGKDGKDFRIIPRIAQKGQMIFALEESTDFVDNDKIKLSWGCIMINPGPLSNLTSTETNKPPVSARYFFDFGREGRVFNVKNNVVTEDLIFVPDRGRCTK